MRWGSVEWTLLCMLYLRACESRSAQPILDDQLAAQHVARIDYDWERVHRAVRPAINQFGVALRGAQFDALVTNYLAAHQNATVLHLGCGLHSRATRLTIPPGVRWFDVDLPQVIALRRQLYAESGRYHMIGSSVTDPLWLDQIPKGGPALIVAEGVLMYLTPDDLKRLLPQLLDRFDSGELLADLLSPWGPRLSRSGIIKWGTRDGREITRWDARLRLIDDSSVIAGFEKIPLTTPRLLYRIQSLIRTTRNYDRLFQYRF
ncbi:methyltransferase [Mycobacterium sp. 852002-51152_SCH6134967]|nr:MULTISPECIES: class I SAM-dependent methyltransferase [Mycobacterium]OBF99050.1 methyltransferase [Mycobacterium sp. 852002-51152_SCH6134967]